MEKTVGENECVVVGMESVIGGGVLDVVEA